MITHKTKTANAISGKTARACESCLKSRARWFCPADDAFLCQACDSAVHSANELAARHNRVRLQTASLKPTMHHNTTSSSQLPAWHHGFTKKARTPRHGKRAQLAAIMMPVVPEMSGDEGSMEEEESEAQMVFSVPTFNPNFDVPYCDDELFNISMIGPQGDQLNHDWSNLPESGPGFGFEKDLVEFAEDVESLLEQQGTDEQELHSFVPCYFITSRETDSERLVNTFLKNEEMMVKVEDQFDWAMDLDNEVMDFEVNNCHGEEQDDEEEEEMKVVVGREIESEILGHLDQIEENNNNKRRKLFLRLNYEEIINAWDGSSPWTNGCRPELDLNHDYWPNYMGGTNEHNKNKNNDRRDLNGGDEGRLARVLRYREKRRTRLFSKKIRYEVRKLNAEKRPRLKGRFVKRTSLSSAPILGLLGK